MVPPLLSSSSTDDLPSIIIALIGFAIPLWLLLATTYEIDDETLRVRSGPFRWLIPLDEIERVEETRSALSAPALSLDRIRIVYGSGKSIMVSPQNKEDFITVISGV